MERTRLATPPQVRAAAVRVVTARPDFVPVLLARIASPDHEVARDAMYLAGDMHPAPAEAGDAVRARAAEVVRIAEAIDPAATDSQTRLYAEAHVLWTGVLAASFGLQRAGVDLRPELRAMATAARPREKESGGDIWRGSTRVADHFDREATPRLAR